MMALLIGIASPLPAVADLSWMAGHWLACSARGETAETWTDDRGGVLLGLSKSVRDGRARWELSRIDQHAGAVTFSANPEGQSPTAFKASSVGSDKVVFENAGHVFPSA